MTTETIEVSLGKEGGKKVFDSLDEAKAWLTTEKQFWSWITSPPWQGNAHPQCSNVFNTFFSNVENAINGAKSVPDAQRSGYLNNIRQHFRDFYEDRGIFSGTPRAKFLDQHRQKDMRTACFACAFFMRLEVGFAQTEGMRGALIAVLFDSGMTEREVNETQALQELRKNWETTAQGFKNSLNDENEKQKQWLKDALNLTAETKKNFGTLVENAKSEWAKLQKTYDATLALHAPVTYWRRKVRYHKWASIIFGGVTLLVMAGAVIGLYPEIKEMLKIPENYTKEPEKWHPEYWRMGIVIVSILFCAWVVRLFVRMFLSNAHLYTDAKERVTMMHTYLALLRRGNLKDEQILFILQAIFRPAGTGLVADDAIPLTALEALTKLKGGKD